MRQEIWLRTSILSMMLLLAAALASSLIAYSGYASRRAAIVAAQEAMDAESEAVLGRLRLLLVPPISVVELATTLEAVCEPPSVGGHRAEAFFYHTLQRFPAFRSMFAGFGDGSYIQVFRLTPDRAALMAAIDAPADAGRAVRLVTPGAAGSLDQVWQFYAPDGQPLAERQSAEPATDQRLRPWFKAAQAASTTIRTEPAQFLTGEIGVTVARACTGRVAGAVGVDVTVEELEGFLAGQPLAAAGLISVFGDTGRVTASSRFGSPSDAASHSRQAALLAMTRAGDLDQTRETEIDGRLHLLRVTALPFTFGDHAYLGIAEPVAHFTGPLRAIAKQTAFVSLLIVACFLPLMLVASRSIARPLRALTLDVDRIRAFRLEDGSPIRSRIIEVNRLARSVAMTKKVLRSFVRYVPRELVSGLLEAGAEPALGGERREISVLFTDLAGFTDYTERTDPETVMLALSQHFAVTAAAVKAEAGTIDKFIGDAVMAFWNAPAAHDDHVAAACRAALAIRAGQAALNSRWAEEGRPAMSVRFGIHCGEALVGHVGSDDRLNYTAMGVVVNLASRLEQLNRELGTAILVSAAVVEGVRGRFLFKQVAVVQPKGIARCIPVFELLGPA